MREGEGEGSSSPSHSFLLSSPLPSKVFWSFITLLLFVAFLSLSLSLVSFLFFSCWTNLGLSALSLCSSASLLPDSPLSSPLLLPVLLSPEFAGVCRVGLVNWKGRLGLAERSRGGRSPESVEEARAEETFESEVVAAQRSVCAPLLLRF